MTTPVKLKETLYQGTTQRIPLVRRYLPFAVTGDACAGFQDACTGTAVQPGDYTDEDYTGCTARMQLREAVDASEVLLDLTTENGGIELDGNKLTLVFTPDDTIPLSFDKGVGHVEVIRPDTSVERQYEIAFKFSPEGTR